METLKFQVNVPETIGNSNEILTINANGWDVIPARIHGSEMVAVDGGEKIYKNFLAQKWYKFDIVSRLGGTTEDYTIYVNGKRVLSKTTSQMGGSFNYVKFLNAYNTNYMVFDNLSVSSIEHGETLTWVYENNKLTASAPISNGDEYMMVAALYNKATNALKEVAIGEFNNDSNMSTAQINNYDEATDIAKAFVWNRSNLSPVTGVAYYPAQ